MSKNPVFSNEYLSNSTSMDITMAYGQSRQMLRTLEQKEALREGRKKCVLIFLFFVELHRNTTQGLIHSLNVDYDHCPKPSKSKTKYVTRFPSNRRAIQSV